MNSRNEYFQTLYSGKATAYSLSTTRLGVLGIIFGTLLMNNQKPDRSILRSCPIVFFQLPQTSKKTPGILSCIQTISSLVLFGSSPIICVKDQDKTWFFCFMYKQNKEIPSQF